MNLEANLSWQNPDEEEINLHKLIKRLLKSWKIIFCTTFLCIAVSVLYLSLLPKVFKSEILIAPTLKGSHEGSSILSQLGSLPSLVGLSNTQDIYLDKSLAILETRKFLSSFIKKNDLLPKLFPLQSQTLEGVVVKEVHNQPEVDDGIEVLRKAFEVTRNEKTGLITLAVFWSEANATSEWANDLVKHLNDQLRAYAINHSSKRIVYLQNELAKTNLQEIRTIIYNLLEVEKQKAMLANVREDFAFEVLDPAVVPKSPIKKNTVVIISFSSICGILLGTFIVLIMHYFQNFIKREP